MFGIQQADTAKISMPLDAVTILGKSVCNDCSKYGDFEKGSFYQSMQDFLAKSRMTKDHFHRESIIHDIYYAVLITAERFGTGAGIRENIQECCFLYNWRCDAYNRCQNRSQDSQHVDYTTIQTVSKDVAMSKIGTSIDSKQGHD
jgi:hypothetical protein